MTGISIDVCEEFGARAYTWGSGHLRGSYVRDLPQVQNLAVAGVDSVWLARFNSELDRISCLEEGWNGYESPRPSRQAVEQARRFLDTVASHGMKPSRIAPSVDGGVVVSFLRGAIRANLEFFGEETAAAIVREGEPPRVWEVVAEEEIEAALGEIREVLQD